MSRQLKNQIAFWGAVIFMLLITMCTIRDASAHHHIVNNYYPVQETNLTGVSDSDRRAIRGTSIAMCLSGAQFDYAKGWQGSGAGSWWRDEQAVCGHFAKRVDDILFTGGVGCDVDFEDCGGVIAGSWHF